MSRRLAPALLLAVASTALVSSAAATPLSSVGSSPVAPQPGFRVLPYLQQPTSSSMTVVWVGERDTPGSVTVNGPGIGKVTQTSDPRRLDLMEYSDVELAQTIRGLAQGSWLYSDDNYQHIVT